MRVYVYVFDWAGPAAGLRLSVNSFSGSSPRFDCGRRLHWTPGCEWIWGPFLVSMMSFLAGWWFGTFFMFHNIWDNPSH